MGTIKQLIAAWPPKYRFLLYIDVAILIFDLFLIIGVVGFVVFH